MERLWNPASFHQITASSEERLHFLNFLKDQMNERKSKPAAPDSFLDVPDPSHNIWSSFLPVSVEELWRTVAQLKRSSSCVDMIPPKFLSEVWDVPAPRLLPIMNTCLSSGCVPEYLKTACVQALIKDPASILLTTTITEPAQSFLLEQNFWRTLSVWSFLKRYVHARTPLWLWLWILLKLLQIVEKWRPPQDQQTQLNNVCRC